VAAEVQPLAVLDFGDAAELLPAGEIMIHTDAGAVRLYKGVDPVPVLAAVLDVHALRESLLLQTEFLLEPLPVPVPLLGRPGLIGVDMDMVQRLPAARVRGHVAELLDLPTDVAGHQAATPAH
jgi:hypothetical protein